MAITVAVQTNYSGGTNKLQWRYKQITVTVQTITVTVQTITVAVQTITVAVQTNYSGGTNKSQSALHVYIHCTSEIVQHRVKKKC